MEEGQFVQSNDANRFKPLPSLSNEELWELMGERGADTNSVDALVSKFDVWIHNKGKLYFRMKPNATFHGDSMGMFPLRGDYGDKVHVMQTHYRNEDGSLKDLDNVFEISHSIDLCDLQSVIDL